LFLFAKWFQRGSRGYHIPALGHTHTHTAFTTGLARVLQEDKQKSHDYVFRVSSVQSAFTTPFSKGLTGRQTAILDFSRVGHHTFIGIYGVHTVFLAG
jgi:hypothetical protein